MRRVLGEGLTHGDDPSGGTQGPPIEGDHAWDSAQSEALVVVVEIQDDGNAKPSPQPYRDDDVWAVGTSQEHVWPELPDELVQAGEITRHSADQQGAAPKRLPNQGPRTLDIFRNPAL
jgi:hypothetical protein